MSRSNDFTIFDDNNYRLLLPDSSGYVQPQLGGGDRRVMGCRPRPAGRVVSSAKRFEQSDIAMVPRSEWAERIASMERTKTRLSDIYKRHKLPVQDQNGFGWCHAYSPCNAVMLMLAMQGVPYVRLSEASIAGPVTGWKNRGAWIGEDLEQITKTGVAAWDQVPEFCTDPRTAKDGWEDDARKRLVIEWVELPSRSEEAVMSCLFARLPVCVGLNWWGHAVTYHDPIPGGGVRFLNSWSEQFEDGGWGMLRGSKALADEAYALRAVKWSE